MIFMKKSTKYFTSLATAVILFSGILAGCGNSAKNSADTSASVGDLKVAYKNPDKAINNGTLNVALVQDEPFTGIFSFELLQTNADQALVGPTHTNGNSMFKTDSHFKITDGGAANIRLDKATNSSTITLRKGIRWSDGHKITAKDLEFAYELVANPAYGSPHYTSTVSNIVGFEDFHNGKTKTITGITYPHGEDGDSIRVQFHHLTAGMWNSGNDFYNEDIEPYHYLKNVAPAKLVSSKEIRQAPLSYGPYVVSKVVPGQSVTYVPNKYYYGPKPKLKKLVISVVSPAVIGAALKDKKYDVALQMPATAYPVVKKLSDYVQTGQRSLTYGYLAFNVGHFDAQTNTNIQDRKTPLQSAALRQAIGYAMNVDQVTKKFGHGLQTRANSTIGPIFGKYNDPKVKGFPLDISKANNLLDKAGFKWDKAHKYRLTPAGKPFTLTFLGQSIDPNAAAIDQNYIQQWQKIGVRVKLYKDRLFDHLTWGQKMLAGNSNDWDITDGQWSVSSDPSQFGLYGQHAPYNFGHFTNPTLEGLLKNVDALDAVQPSARQEAFYKYQQYMQDQAPVIPTYFALDWVPVNKRVVGWSNDHADDQYLWANVGVSAAQPK